MDSTNQRLISSYLWLRRIIGGLAFALPVVLLIWGYALSGSVLDSLSSYYSLRTRDVFVGTLFAIAFFLIAYKGYNSLDDNTSNLAGVFALGVAFFPNTAGGWQANVHFICASGLFLTLSLISLFFFTKTKGQEEYSFRQTLTSFRFGTIQSNEADIRQKKTRNKVYVACGLTMLAFLLITLLYYLFLKNTGIATYNPVLVFEWLMIWAFGISWLIKGETLWKNQSKTVTNPK